jgi:8-oxo-dGTP pyrophosphatase MutT (NUDIX family)
LDSTHDEHRSYEIRRAARAIVQNDRNEIAILHVSKDHYHKLPGGGIEPGEDPLTALRRELMEEVGVEVEVLDEVGVILEFRQLFGFLQISYCYLTKVVGEFHGTSFTEKEIREGFAGRWFTLDEAIARLAADLPAHLPGRFIRERDLTFLRAAREMVQVEEA